MARIKPKYIVGKTVEELARIKEEYESIGFYTTLNGDVLTVHLLKPAKKTVKKEDSEEDEDKTKRVPKRERKYGFTRATEED